MKNMKTPVSVVMPVYNAELFLEESIESILNQTFTDFEFIIIDDGSSDRSLEIIKSYSDKRIQVLENRSNRGNYYARNKGYRASSGKYICVMDADDISFPERLEVQYTYLEFHKDVLAIGSTCSYLPFYRLKPLPYNYDEIKLALLGDNCFVHSSLLIRSDAFSRVNGYDEQYIYSADYDLMCKLSLLGKVENLRKPLVSYRWSDVQISQLHVNEQKYFATKIAKQYQKHFINENLNDDQKLVTDADLSFYHVGTVIAYYTYARKFNSQKIEDIADSMLDGIFENVSYDMPFRLNNGLLGLGCGLIYLLRSKMVEGDEDEILSRIDSMTYKKLNQLDDDGDVDWYGWLYYFRLRITGECLEGRTVYKLIFRQYAIYLLDCILRCIHRDFVLDGQTISEIEKYHQMGLCPETTSDILSLYGLKSNTRISFVIPVRIDSSERTRNLDLVIEQLLSLEGFADIEIRILEADELPHYVLKIGSSRIYKKFVKDISPIFHRTKYLNQLIGEASGSIVGIWDTDVLIPQNQILQAIDAIKNGNAIMSFPYDGRFYMLPSEESKLFSKGAEIENFSENINKYPLPYGPNSVGGAFLVNKEIYIRNGGENQNFYGWGPEDAERYKRMEILGLPIYRSQGPLIHLFHPRMQNSWFGNKDLEKRNREEFLKVSGMTRIQLLQYISTWKKTNNNEDT